MVVMLIGKNFFKKLSLPKAISGNYWISVEENDEEKKLVNVIGENGLWKVHSNDYSKILSKDYLTISDEAITIAERDIKIATIDFIELEEYSSYYMQFGDSEDIFLLYCMPSYEKNFEHLYINTINEFTIGISTKNEIVYNYAPLISAKHAKISHLNDGWIIENYDLRYGIFVNDEPVYMEKRFLKNGDIIFIMGLELIIIERNLFINNPKGNVKYGKDFNKIKIELNPIDEETKEKEDFELYHEKDYFLKAPRLTNVIEEEKVVIDSPPALDDSEEMPAILTIGTTMTMGIVMMVTMTQSISGISSGKSTLGDSIAQILTSVIMMIGMILFPVLIYNYQKKQKIKHEEKRQKRYKRYVKLKSNSIDMIINKQKNILEENYITANDCTDIVLHKNSRLWERKIEDRDFLSIRLGIGGAIPSLEIDYPEEHFSMVDDNLLEIVEEIGEKSKIIKDAPIIFSFPENPVSAVVSDNRQHIESFIKNIIIQLTTFHSYIDFKLVFLTKEGKAKEWEYLKMLPHLWDDSKQIRFFSDNYDEMKEISKYLLEDFRERTENNDIRDDDEAFYKNFLPYYLIIVDSYKNVEKLGIITEVLKTKKNVGFGILCLSNDLIQLPKECKTFIVLNEDKTGAVLESEMASQESTKKFIVDDLNVINEKLLFKKMANIPIKYSQKSKFMLPNTYTFLEMYKVRKNRTIKCSR